MPLTHKIKRKPRSSGMRKLESLRNAHGEDVISQERKQIIDLKAEVAKWKAYAADQVKRALRAEAELSAHESYPVLEANARTMPIREYA